MKHRMVDGCRVVSGRASLFLGTEMVGDVAQLYFPEGIPTDAALAGRVDFLPERDLGMIQLRWDVPIPSLVGCSRVLVLNAFRPEEDNAPWIVDSLSTIMPIGNPESNRLKLLELFSGGYGGWHAAVEFLEHVLGLHAQVVGLDCSVPAVLQHAVSHSCVAVSGCSLPPGVFVCSQRDFVIHAHVEDDHWLPEVARWRPNCIALSAPCPPWSAAGNGDGLDSSDGRLFLRAIEVCRLLAPHFVVVEQVFAFASHPHKSVVLEALRWSGHKVIWNKVIEAADQGPVHRARWICLAVHVSYKGPSLRFGFWEPVRDFVPSTFGAVLRDRALLDDPRLAVNGDLLSKSSRHDMLPPAKRPRVKPEHVLATRCYKEDVELPTFVSAYGSQHCFSDDSLKSKGLLAHFHLQPDGSIRLWRPLEVAPPSRSLWGPICATGLVSGLQAPWKPNHDSACALGPCQCGQSPYPCIEC